MRLKLALPGSLVLAEGVEHRFGGEEKSCAEKPRHRHASPWVFLPFTSTVDHIHPAEKQAPEMGGVRRSAQHVAEIASAAASSPFAAIRAHVPHDRHRALGVEDWWSRSGGGGRFLCASANLGQQVGRNFLGRSARFERPGIHQALGRLHVLERLSPALLLGIGALSGPCVPARTR